MSRSVAQKINLDGFVKPGELVEARATVGLSLQDRRIFNLLIENAWSEIGENKTHRIAIAKLRGPRHESGDRVADSIKALMSSIVEVPTTLNGEPAILAMQLLGPTTRTFDESSPNAMLEYKFSEELRKVIQESRYWGRIKSHVMFAFSSKYSLALYEAICLRANLRVDYQDFSVDDFRVLLGVEPGKLERFPDFNKYAVKAAVAEVNALSDFTIEIDPIREGGPSRGKLKGFRLSWEKKSSDEWRAVLDELLRPKVGRKARIRGRVEVSIPA